MWRWARQKTGSAPGHSRVAGVRAGLILAPILMLASPTTAWSDMPAAEAATGVGSVAASGSTVRPAIFPPGIITPDVGTGDFIPGSFDDLLGADDGSVADALPHALGKPIVANIAAIDPFHIHTPAPAAGGFDWNALANQNLGAPNILALSINQHFASSTSFATAIDLRHSAGPLDVDVALTGAQSLAGPSRMALAYDSNALIAMTPALRIGVTAKGDLGPQGALAPAERQAAGPMMQLRLLDGRTTISSDAGYDFSLNPDGAVAPHRLHAKIDFKAKF